MSLSSENSDVSAPAGRRGAKVYLAGTVTSQVCALVRYTLIARLLGPEQLGLAATVILTQQFFDSMSDSGTDRFLIQNRDGDTLPVQRLVQLVMLGRGLFTALAMVALSVPISMFYKAPALQAGLVMLAIAPLIAGLTHVDLRRRQRHHDFRIDGTALLFGESLGLAATVIAAFVVHNYTAVLWGLIVKAAVMVTVSHLMSERRFTIGYSREYAGMLAAFGLPLVLNGLCFFLGSQGDRLLIANRLGQTELGLYSAVILLISSPAAMISKFLITMHLPRLAAGRDDPDREEAADNTLGGVTAMLCMAMCAGFALVAPFMVVVLYGSRFATPAVLVCLIGILQTSRLIRLWPSTGALGVGRSDIVLADNLSRLVGLPLALLGIQAKGVVGLEGAVLGLIVGELIALCTTKALLNRAKGLFLLHGFDRIATFVAVCLTAFAWAWSLQKPSLILILACAAATAGLLVRILLSERAAIAEGMALASWPLRRFGGAFRGARTPAAAATDTENRLA